MIPKVLMNPRVQKWSLFTSLVVSLGFNLSMNPQAPQLARNGVQTMDLAQLAAPASTGVNTADPNLAFGSIINLGDKTSDERLKNYGVVLTLNVEGDKVSYIIKKKTSTEGYSSEGCDECHRKSMDTPKQFDKNNASHIQAIIAKIADEEQDRLMKAPKLSGKDKKEEATAKSDEKDGREMFAESCRKKSDDELMDCQYSVIQAEIEACPKWSSSCESKLKAKFKPFEDMFKACTKGKKSKFKSIEDVDCESAKDFAENILEDVPSEYALKKASSFLQSTVIERSAAYRDQLVKRHVDPLTVSNLVKTQFDRTAGTYSVQVPQYDSNGRFVKMVDGVSPYPANGTYGSSVLKHLLTNDRFKSQEAAADFFKSNFYDALSDTRTALYKSDVSAFSYPSVDLETGYSGIQPPDLSQYRGMTTSRSGGAAIPAMPTVDAVPANTRPAGATVNTQVTPGTVMQNSGQGYMSNATSGTLLSPAQRGQLRQ